MMPILLEVLVSDRNNKIHTRFVNEKHTKYSHLKIMENKCDGNHTDSYVVDPTLLNSDILTILPNFCHGIRENSDILSDQNIEVKVEVDDKNCNHSPSCKKAIVSLKKPLNLFKRNHDKQHIEFSDKLKTFTKKTALELQELSKKELQVLLEDLSKIVERVSSKLVSLLLENDALQQESDARNVAIEQLLKLTVKNTDADPRPVQMSIVLPSEDCDEL